ncbi:helix-turn-helix domain-containing protein [uncultured Bacteroides sp.]|uniref:helix-turn-helix domain-containing protein n=1 Tax=uncultured Bacteroides sp. TaxID=162156 RepID=UPI00259A5A9E|nr:helix-turn-helix domain-containing protein [uncultured Bacteroides sp.]
MENEKKRKDLFERWVESGEVENNLAIIQALSMQGKSMAEIAEAFEISRRTLQNLQKEHPALKKAISSGRLSVVAMCQNKLMERVASGDTTAIIYALKVYGGDFFNDRKAVEAKITGTPVSVQPQVQIYLPERDTEVGENGEKEE